MISMADIPSNRSIIIWGATYAIRYKNSLFRSVWRYRWSGGGGIPNAQLEIICRWVPLWEPLTLDMLHNDSWWNVHPERNIARYFVEDYDFLTGFAPTPDVYRGETYLPYWGIQKNGKPFIYGSLTIAESTGPVVTKTEISNYLLDGVNGETGPFSSIRLWTCPFYDKR